MRARRVALGAEFVIPVLALAFAIYFLVSTADLEWEAKANGVIIGGLLLPLLALQFVRGAVALARRRADLSFAPLLQPADALPKRIGMVAITIALVATMPWLGVGLGLFLALSGGLILMGVRGVGHALRVAFAVALATTLLFTVALDSNLPRGPVENLLFRLVR